ncbi:hypothetical protein [Amycolatopsis minnesotensis]|uniref:Uncharacterized protein n=1 Tax=Amycolatopsis minnesotensis TaxID=337894 RepID=A0ABN2QTJ0_9PSEU
MDTTTELLSKDDVLERTGFLRSMFANERHSLGEALDNLLANLDDFVTLIEHHSYEADRDRCTAVTSARRFRDATLHQLTAAYERHPDCPW